MMNGMVSENWKGMRTISVAWPALNCVMTLETATPMHDDEREPEEGVLKPLRGSLAVGLETDQRNPECEPEHHHP